MSDWELIASPPLAGFDRQDDGISLSEVTDHALVSIAIRLGCDTVLHNTMLAEFGAGLPECGNSTVATNGDIRFLGMQQDQTFALFRFRGNHAAREIAKNLAETAYYTDQSDSWAMLQISGSRARAALERICPLDLHQDVFALGSVARTTMEYLAVIILRTGKDAFLLMSPRSSARSFLHALETSMENVL